MIRRDKNNLINREITFPIKIDDQIITASPGDSVASALYNNNHNSIKKIKFYSQSELIFLKKMNYFLPINSGDEVDLGFNEILCQEAYPGLEINSNKTLYDIYLKFKNKFFTNNSVFINKIIHFIETKKKSNEKNKRIVDSFENISAQILIVGGGISGLLAASIIVKAGIKVTIIERDFILGGIANSSNKKLKNWTYKLINNLVNSKNCLILKNTNLIFTDRKNNYFAVRKIYYRDKNYSLRQSLILLKINAEHVIIATGLKERSLPDININHSDIMLASDIDQLVNRFGLKIPNGIVIYTNNNFGWDTAFNLSKLGVEIKAIIDTRKTSNISINCPVYRGAKIIKTQGNNHLKSIKIIDENNKIFNIKTSFLIISGGFDLNLGSISENIESLNWCAKSLTFQPKKYSTKVDFLFDFNDIHCVNSLLKNTLEITFKILKKNKVKMINYKIPLFETLTFNGELLQKNNFLMEKGLFYLNFFQKKFSENLIYLNFIRKNGIDKLGNLKSKALTLYSNDKLIRDDIKHNLFFLNKENKLYFKFIDQQTSFSNYISQQIKTPYKTTRCYDFYKKLGIEKSLYNDWLIPKFFFKNGVEKDELSCIEHELSMINTIGFTDESDLGKITIHGNDTLRFLQKIKKLDGIQFKKNRFFSFILAKYDNSILERLLFIIINNEKVLILLNSKIEKQFYDYLLSKLLSVREEINCNIYLETDIFQVFSLVGSFAKEFLISKFSIPDLAFSKIIRNKIYKFDYFGEDIVVIIQNKQPEFYANIIIQSSFALKFLKEIHPKLKNINGGIIGRECLERIKLESGLLSWNHSQDEKLRLPLLNSNIGITNKEKFEDINFKFYPDSAIYSKMLCLVPQGLTKNIVIGSNTYIYENGKKLSLLGKVVFCFYSKKIDKVIALIFLSEKVCNFNFVLVENLSKNYQTLCKVKSYHELFSNIE